MSQAFYTAIGGISSSQKKIDVIADNIANMNTVAFKESNAYFETVFSRTLSMGNAPSAAVGGTNPLQIGLGVQLASITRNFSNGTTQSTGRTSDLYLGGPGFFTVDGGNNEILLTRAGNFNIDPEGYLVTTNGNRVFGTDTLYGSLGSTTPILIPPKLTLEAVGNTNAAGFGNKSISEGELNNFLEFEDGDFNVQVELDNGDTVDINIDITGQTEPADVNNNLNQIIATVNTALDTGLGDYAYNSSLEDSAEYIAAYAVQIGIDPTDEAAAEAAGMAAAIAVPANIAAATAARTAAEGMINMMITTDAAGDSNGTISLEIDNASDVRAGVKMTALDLSSGASNFTDITKLAQAPADEDTAAGTLTYTSAVLDYQAEVSPTDDVLSADSLTAFNINPDGSVAATYSNGDKISVETRDTTTNGYKYITYTLPNGVEIKQEDITINGGILEPANLQLQLGTVINEKGLLSEGGNAFSVGPNSGDLTFSVGADNGFGAVNNGGLESSNVDLPTQFAEMIVTQRAIEANSRSFDTVSQILQRIISIGR